MQFPEPLPVRQLAADFKATLLGDAEQMALGINEIHHVRKGDVTFVDVAKYYNVALESAATIIFINKTVEPPPGKTLLVLEHPFAAYDSLVRRYRNPQPLSAHISELADIHPTAILEPGVVVGPYARIGARCHIQANAYIGAHCILGDDVVVQVGSVIGSDAFYFKKTAEGFTKWCSGGRVILEDGVDIGAQCTINRGVSSDTVIGKGSKLDCQVQIGHDTKVGERCLMAAQVGVAGNCHIGNDVVLYGQVGVAQNISIGDKTVVGAKSGVSKSLEGGKTYLGSPAQEMRQAYKELATLRQLARDGK